MRWVHWSASCSAVASVPEGINPGLDYFSYFLPTSHDTKIDIAVSIRKSVSSRCPAAICSPIEQASFLSSGDFAQPFCKLNHKSYFFISLHKKITGRATL